jgi:hypothetical protein
VLAVNPVTAYEVLVTVASKYYLDISSYPAATLSVEAVQVKLVDVAVVEAAVKPVGAVGAVASGAGVSVVTFTVLLKRHFLQHL